MCGQLSRQPCCVVRTPLAVGLTRVTAIAPSNHASPSRCSSARQPRDRVCAEPSHRGRRRFTRTQTAAICTASAPTLPQHSTRSHHATNSPDFKRQAVERVTWCLICSLKIEAVHSLSLSLSPCLVCVQFLVSILPSLHSRPLQWSPVSRSVPLPGCVTLSSSACGVQCG